MNTILVLMQDTIATARDTSPAAVTRYETGALALVGLLFLILGLVFVLMLLWYSRVEQTTYVGQTLSEAMVAVQSQLLLSQVEAAWIRGEFHEAAVKNSSWFQAHPPPPPPAEIESDRVIQLAIAAARGKGRIGTLPPGLGGSPATHEYLGRLRSWESGTLAPEAERLRDAEEVTKRKEARDRARRAIGSIDLPTLRGRGPEFILRFTAVVVIIFAVMALGILGRLSSEQSGTILAAIAGYVLGQATSAASRPKGGAQKPDAKTSDAGPQAPAE